MDMTITERDQQWEALYLELRERLRRDEITVAEMRERLAALFRPERDSVSR